MVKKEHWLELTGKEKQNKEDRYNKIMDAVTSLPNMFQNFAFSEDIVILGQSTIFYPDERFYYFFKVYDSDGDPLVNEGDFTITGWRTAGLGPDPEYATPSYLMKMDLHQETDENGEIIGEFGMPDEFTDPNGLYTFVCNYTEFCGATASTVILNRPSTGDKDDK